MPIQTSDNKFAPAKFIVNPTAGLGTHTTIQAAINAATAGSTIFITPGTYVENLSLSVNNLFITSYPANGVNYDGGPLGVVIQGKMSFPSSSITCFISGIQFTTNSDYIFSETSNHTVSLYLFDCFFYSSTNSMFNYSGTGGMRLYMWNCNADINGNIAFYTFSGSGGSSIILYACNILDTVGSSTPSSFSTTNGTVDMRRCDFENAMTVGSNATMEFDNCRLDPQAIIALATITLSGTSQVFAQNCVFDSDNNAAISAGAGTTATITTCTVRSAAANAFTGAGTVDYSGITFPNTSTTNATTENYFPLTVKQGGTGDSSFTAYSVICGGTTSTGALQNVSGLGSGDQVLSSNGAGALPTWKDISSDGILWNNISASQTLAVGNGYFCSGGANLSLLLPATSGVGDTIIVILKGSTSWTITQAAGQQIQFGTQATTLGVGGSLASTAIGNAVTIVCQTADTIWCVQNSIGNLTVI